MNALPLRPGRRGGARGFTLVEVLVGALILGIFISFVYGAVISAFQVREVVQSTTSALASGTLAVEFVAQDLESAFLPPLQGEGLEPEAFKAEEESGHRARLDFLTTRDSRIQEEVDRRMLRSDITEVGYRTRPGEHGDVLYRREQFGVDDRPLEGGDWHKVVDGVQEFTIEWHEAVLTEADAEAKEDPPREWDAKERKRLPAAAKIVLVLEGRSADPSRPEETARFRFTRWVVLPTANDVALKPAAPGNPAPGDR